MKISIIIPTHNRAESLREAIESIIALGGEAEFEIVVVDNNSTDHTKKTVESFGDVVRYVFESCTAFSRARRTGAENAKGDVFVYIDDDVIIRPGALRGIVDIFSRGPDLGIIAGKIDAKFTQTPPEWTLACNDSFNGWSLYNPETYSFLGNEFTEVPSAAGPMMAIRRNVFEQVGGFPPDTMGVETNVGDRSFKKLFIGPGDYGLCLKTRAHGYKVCYSPEVACYHVIPPIRFTIGFWRSRMIGEGHYTTIANRGFFHKSENQIYIENKRAQIRYSLCKRSLKKRVKELTPPDSGNLESMGMLPEELWVHFYAAYLEMDWALGKHPDLWKFLWEIAAEGVADNDFDYVMNRLPTEYKEIVGADGIKDLLSVHSISTYECLIDNMRHEVTLECNAADSLLREVYHILRKTPEEVNVLNMFLADDHAETAIRALRSVQEIHPSDDDLGRWIQVLSVEAITKTGESVHSGSARKPKTNGTNSAKAKLSPGVDKQNSIQTSEEILHQRAKDLKAVGESLVKTENFDGALQKLDESMYLNPRLPNLQRFRAICLAALHRKREAVFAACAELAAQPDDHLMLEIIVSNLNIPIEEIKRSPTQTLALLDRIIRYAGDRISGLQYLRSLCLIVLSRLSEAVSALEQNVRQSPKDNSMTALLEKAKLAQQFETG